MSTAHPEPAPEDLSALETPTETVEAPVVNPNDPELLGWDRCDHRGCGAQAYVRVVIPTAPTAVEIHDWLNDDNRAAYETIGGVQHPKSLLWCSHHAAEHEGALTDAVVSVDERHRLGVKLTSSY